MKAPEPVVYAYNWSGFYIGAHAGGGWGEKCFTFAAASDGCHDGNGAVAGGQLGFNYQTGQFVFGVEFSGSWANITGDHVGLLAPFGTYHSEINTILMLTGRVGMAFDRTLLYVTGGGAWANAELDYTRPARRIQCGQEPERLDRRRWHRVRLHSELVDRRAIQLH